jgi:hypothetical protein
VKKKCLVEMEQDQMVKDHELDGDEDKAEGLVWGAVLPRAPVVCVDAQIVAIQNPMNSVSLVIIKNVRNAVHQ